MIIGKLEVLATTANSAITLFFFPDEKHPRLEHISKKAFPFGVRVGMEGKFAFYEERETIDGKGDIVLDIL